MPGKIILRWIIQTTSTKVQMFFPFKNTCETSSSPNLQSYYRFKILYLSVKYLNINILSFVKFIPNQKQENSLTSASKLLKVNFPYKSKKTQDY